MQLSKHFKLEEFTKSQVATRKGIKNQPNSGDIKNLTDLCYGVLEKARVKFDKPIVISSGFRILELNRAIGSGDSSQHTKGMAADIEIAGVPNIKLAYWIQANCDFDQLILEHYKPEEDNPPRRSMYYLYPPGGYIGWHDDSKYEFASIICLNKVWDPNWGGIHLYEDLKGLGIRGEIPTFNKGLVHSGGVPHGVSILAPEAPFRRVIITFGPLGPSFPHPKANEADKKWREWKRKRNVGWAGSGSSML